MTKTATFLRLLLIPAISGVLGAVFALPGTAAAAESLGYQISPPVQTLTMDRGTSARSTIKVTNLTDAQMSLQIGKRNFVAKGEEGEVELVDNGDPLYSLSPFFTLGQNVIDVPPKGTREVAYVLNVPIDAEPGGRYGSITFNTIAAKLPSGQSGASVKQELAALIFLRINGTAHEQLSIDTFKTGKSFYEYGPVGFETRIKNLGNVHAKPTGEIVIKNFGFKTATIKLDEKNVIPGAIRKVEAQLKPKLLFGHYTATLTLKNGAVQTLTASTSFTAIPYKFLGVVILILIAVTFFFWKTRKRFRRAFRILAGKE